MDNNKSTIKSDSQKQIAVSIILPVYNGEKYLSDTLESLVKQSFVNCEIIAINDGSVDRSLSILEKYKSIDNRLTIINTHNQGICNARNTGIRAAKGKYLMFCDHDDTYNPGYVEKAYQIITKGNYDYVKFSCVEIYVQDGKTVKCTKILINDNEFLNNSLSIIYEYTNYREYIWDGIYSKDLIEKIGGFDARFISGSEDVDLFLKLVKVAHSCATVSWVAYNHFIRRDSSTSQKYTDNSYDAVVQMYERKMDVNDSAVACNTEYSEIKTRDFLYTIMAIFANKTCPLSFHEVYRRLLLLYDSSQFTRHIIDVKFTLSNIRSYPALLYRMKLQYCLAAICLAKRWIS